MLRSRFFRSPASRPYGLLAQRAFVVPSRGVTITARTGTAVDGGPTFWRVRKLSGGNAYNADAISNLLVGDFTLTITYVSGQFFLAGVSGAPSTAADASDIKFGLEYYSTGNTLYAYRNGITVVGANIVLAATSKMGRLRRRGTTITWDYWDGSAWVNLLTDTTVGNDLNVGFDASIYSQGAYADCLLVQP